ncbi:MAG: hypothetical protein HC893_07680 [Chloroflexaceae bacterium]|nr:hypothetical protein [Chloroflexaceae bacterium]
MSQQHAPAPGTGKPSPPRRSWWQSLRHGFTRGSTGFFAGGCTLGSAMALIGGLIGLLVGGFAAWNAFSNDFGLENLAAGQGSGVFLLIWIPSLLIYLAIGGGSACWSVA